MSANLHVLYLSSAAAAQKDLSRAHASFDCSPPIQFPPNTRLKLAVSQTSWTNYFVNISAAIGNNLFYYTDDVLDPIKYSITIPDGSFNVGDLSAALDTGVIANGHTSGLIVLTPDFATNKVYFTINSVGYQLYFPAGTPYVLLGTTLGQKIPAAGLTAVPVYSELAPSTATFNSITTIYLKSSLTYLSNFSGKQSNVIAALVPSVPVGSIQNSEPFFAVWVPAHTLSGQGVSNIVIELTDQNNVPLNLSDDFSCTIMIAEA